MYTSAGVDVYSEPMGFDELRAWINGYVNGFLDGDRNENSKVER